MEPVHHSKPDPGRVRAVFNLVTLKILGYSYEQIEVFHPEHMSSDRLAELIHRKAAEELRRKHISTQPLYNLANA